MNNWLSYTDEGNTEHIINIKDVDDIYVAQADNKHTEQDTFYVYGAVGSNFIHLHFGTQVECMRYFEKLKDILKPVKIDIW